MVGFNSYVLLVLHWILSARSDFFPLSKYKHVKVKLLTQNGLKRIGVRMNSGLV